MNRRLPLALACALTLPAKKAGAPKTAKAHEDDQEGEARHAGRRRGIIHRMKFTPATRVAASLAAAVAVLAELFDLRLHPAIQAEALRAGPKAGA